MSATTGRASSRSSPAPAAVAYAARRLSHRLPLPDNAIGQGLLLVAMGLLALGAVMVYSASATVTSSSPWYHRIESRHLVFAALAAMTLLLLWRIDYRMLAAGGALPLWATVLLAVSFLLCIAVLIPGVGAEVNGARRWMRFGSGPYQLSFQPSELLKFSLLIFLACWLGNRAEQVHSFTRTFLPASAVIGLCVGVVVIEDFGTACLIGVAAGAMLLLAAVPWYYLLSYIPPAAAGFYVFVWTNPMRKARILAFVDPWNEASRWTYQIRQALIAVGSGGMFGKGLGSGQLKLGFVPEDSSDCIFSVICEELGFAGAALLMGLLAMMLYLSWRAGSKGPDKAGRLIAGGLGLLIVLQSLMHIGVNMGSLPPTGMNLPLVSAGGTALVVVAAAVGLMISVTAHNREA